MSARAPSHTVKSLPEPEHRHPSCAEYLCGEVLPTYVPLVKISLFAGSGRAADGEGMILPQVGRTPRMKT